MEEPLFTTRTFDVKILGDLSFSDFIKLDPHFIRNYLFSDEKSIEFWKVALYRRLDIKRYFLEVYPEAEHILQDNKEYEEKQVTKAQLQLVEKWKWNLIMMTNPFLYDSLPWHNWDFSIVTRYVDLKDKIVLDTGAGTGICSFRCALFCKEVIAMEPVFSLRRYIEKKALAGNFKNIRTLNGILEKIPLKDNSIDVLILSSAFGWNREKELEEIDRVVRSGGDVAMIAACRISDDNTIQFLKNNGYTVDYIEAPFDGMKPCFFKKVK